MRPAVSHKSRNSRRRRRFAFRRRSGVSVTQTPSGGRTWEGFQRTMRLAVERLSSDRNGLPSPRVEIGPVKVPKGPPKLGTIIHAPTILSLAPNERSRFLGFLYSYRWEAYVAPTLERHGRSTTLVELADVKDMTLDAALVLVAEYHRNCRNTDYRPLIDDEAWDPKVRQLLAQLGFYTFVQAAGRSGLEDQPISTGRQFVQFETGSEVRGAQARAIIESIASVAGSTPRREDIYSGLVEAMMNVNNHAYLDRPPEVFSPVDSWWIAGSYEQATETLEFVVYDQGVGIPSRIPTDQTYFGFLRRFMKGSEDADLIEAAIELGRTSTDMPGRGNGLWTICRVAAELDGSSVRIQSGRGDVTYSSDGKITKTAYGNPFCGTLVQWTLRMPTETTPSAGRGS